MTDAELLKRWHTARDAEAFHTLVRRYSGLVYGSARRVLNSDADAEDITQDCFERLATRRVVPRRSLGAWLHRVAVNRALDRRKSDVRSKRREEAYAEQAPTAKEDAWNDLAPLVDEAVNRLPRAEREVIVAYFYLQRTQADIARDLNLSRRGVSHRIQRAVTRLRAFLTDQGVTLSATALTTLATARLAEAAPVSVAEDLGRLALAGHRAAQRSTALLRLANWTATHKTAAASAIALVLIGSAFFARNSVSTTVIAPDTISGPAQTAQIPSQRSATQNTPSITQPEFENASNNAETTAVDVSTAAITGRVVKSPMGDGIPGISVQLKPLEPRRRAIRASTDASGTYRFDDLPPGQYEIRIFGNDNYRRPNYDRQEYRTELSAGDTVTIRDFELSKGLILAGRVVNTEGRPVSGARVHAYTEEPSSDSRVDAAPDGSFEIAGLTRSTQAFLCAVADGLAMEPVGPYDITGPGPHRFELVMVPQGIVRGVITDSTGAPIEGIAVVPGQVGRRYSRSWFDFSASNSEGRFETSGLYPGQYRLSFALVQRSGFRTLGIPDVPIEIGAGQVLDGLRLTYAKPQHLSLSGTILSPDGEPVGRATVTVSPSGAASPVYEDLTDKQGGFELTNLEPGTYDLYAIHYTFGERRVAGLEAGTTDTRVVLPERTTVAGAVVDADTNEPVTNFALAEKSRRTDYRQLMNWVDFVQPDGLFVLDGIQPGNREILARAEGYLPESATVRVLAGQPKVGLRITLKPARTIRGAVVDTSGRALQDAQISFVPADPRGLGPRDFDGFRTTSGADGSFQLDLPPDLLGSLKAAHPLYASRTLSIDVDELGPFTLVMPTGGEVRGRFLWNGTPLGGADARIQSGNRIIRHLSTDGKGVFRFTGLDAGTHTVLLGGILRVGAIPLYANAFQAVQAHPGRVTELDVRLEGADTRVTGVLSANGQPWNLGRGRVFLTYDDSAGHLREFYVYFGVDGRFDFQGVPAGLAKLEVSAAGHSNLHIADVFIEEENPLDLQFDVDLGKTQP